MAKRLERDENNKVIAGVASGIAEYLNVDPTWVRLAFVLAVFAGLSGIFIYLILWIVVPAKPWAGAEADYRVFEDKIVSGSNTKRQGNSRIIAGSILIFIGVCFLSNEFHLLPDWFSIEKLWPLALIIPGILILASAGKKEPSEEFVSQETDKTEENIVTDDTEKKDQPQ